MTSAQARRLGAAERRAGMASGPFAGFSDGDLLAALAWTESRLADCERPAAAVTSAHAGEADKALMAKIRVALAALERRP